MLDRTQLDPSGPWRGRALHEKEFTRGAVWITLHDHRPVLEMREQHRRNISVVLKQITFGNFEFRPEKLFQICQLYFTARQFQLELFGVFGNLDATTRSPAARRRRMFGWVIIAMCF